MLKPILLVEDNPQDLELTLIALGKSNLANEVIVVRDGAEAMDFLCCRGEYESRARGNPAVILLDLKLPKLDGIQVLEKVKGDAGLKSIPVVMLTSSREEKDVIRSYALGVNAFVVKPVGFKEFLDAISDLGMFWAVLNEPPPGSPKTKKASSRMKSQTDETRRPGVVGDLAVSILHLEDSPLDAELAASKLRKSGRDFRIEHVITREQFIDALEKRPFDLILSDYDLPQFDGYQALRIVQERWPDVPFIFVSGVLGEEVAVDTLKGGAVDYVLK